MRELSSQHVAKMSRDQRIKTAKSILKGLTAEQRARACQEIPEICDFLEGKKSSCSTSCGPGSPELVELTETLQSLGAELRRYGAAMARKRREELRYQLVKLDLLEQAARAEAEEAA